MIDLFDDVFYIYLRSFTYYVRTTFVYNVYKWKTDFEPQLIQI